MNSRAKIFAEWESLPDPVQYGSHAEWRVGGTGSASGSGEREEYVVLFGPRGEVLVTDGPRRIGFSRAAQ